MMDANKSTSIISKLDRLLYPNAAPVEIGLDHQSCRQRDPCSPYNLIDIIGEGSYGVVYRAADPTGRIVALKTIKLDQNEGIPSTALREIALLRELQHPNIVQLRHDDRLYRVLPLPNALAMVFECADTDLRKFMSFHGLPLPRNKLTAILFQLLHGLEFVHNAQIIHRDIKPENLLLTASGILKIADFGLARGVGVPVRSFTSEIVTLWYRPPDVLLGNVFYSTGLDMWSVGCIFAEMILGYPLFPGTSPTNQLHRIFKLLGTPTLKDLPSAESYSEWKPETFPQFPKKDFKDLLEIDDSYATDLLQSLLVYDSEKRPTARECLNHPYFKKEHIQISPLFLKVS